MELRSHGPRKLKLDDLAWLLHKLLFRVDCLELTQLKVGKRIMTKIQEFITAQEQHNTRQAAAIAAVDTAVAAVNTSVTGISGDIATLNQMILDLQNSPDRITPEDQVRLDAIVEFSSGLSGRAEATATATDALASATAALDAQTPPAVPTP